MKEEFSVRRRQYFAAVASATITALAGCSGDGSDNSSADGEDTEDGTDETGNDGDNDNQNAEDNSTDSTDGTDEDQVNEDGTDDQKQDQNDDESGDDSTDDSTADDSEETELDGSDPDSFGSIPGGIREVDGSEMVAVTSHNGRTWQDPDGTMAQVSLELENTHDSAWTLSALPISIEFYKADTASPVNVGKSLSGDTPVEPGETKGAVHRIIDWNFGGSSREIVRYEIVVG
jgi:hypothetical protein